MTVYVEALRVLRTRLEPFGKSGSIPDDGEGTDASWMAVHPSQAAVLASVCDVLATSGAAGFGEEHHTASFMGHLMTNLHWFSMLEGWSQPPGAKTSTPRISWAYQGRDDEAVSGADFGLVVRPLDGSPDRVALYQAKLSSSLVKSQATSISIGHLIGEPAPDLVRYGGFVRSANAWRDEVPAPDAVLFDGPRYQIEALFSSQLRGREVSGSLAPWCHYAVWHKQAIGGRKTPRWAQTVSVIDVLAAQPTNPIVRPGTYHVGRDRPDLSKAVIDVLVGNDEDTYLEVLPDALPTLLSRVAVLFPGVQFVAVDEGDSGGLDSDLDAAGLSVSVVQPQFNPTPGLGANPEASTLTL